MYTEQEKEVMRVFHEVGLNPGRLISGSKSAYRDKYPNHTVIFNANIFCSKGGKVWWGDLDLDVDGSKLEEIAQKLDTTLYILREMDGRFENETISIEDAARVAVRTYSANG
jgi:hypothetical protein